MSQFTRRARWLQQLFTPSVAPAVPAPTSLSDDVTLVQQYDGGGLAIAEATFPAIRDASGAPLEIRSPEISIRDYQTKIGITTVSDLFNLGPDLVARIFAANLTLTAGIGAEINYLTVTAPTGSGVGNHLWVFSTPFNNVSSPGDQRRFSHDPILPPGMQLNFFSTGGDASSSGRLTIAMIVAPIGTLFHI